MLCATLTFRKLCQWHCTSTRIPPHGPHILLISTGNDHKLSKPRRCHVMLGCWNRTLRGGCSDSWCTVEICWSVSICMFFQQIQWFCKEMSRFLHVAKMSWALPDMDNACEGKKEDEGKGKRKRKRRRRRRLEEEPQEQGQCEAPQL